MQALNSDVQATNLQLHILKQEKSPSMYRRLENKKKYTFDFWRYIFSLTLDSSRV